MMKEFCGKRSTDGLRPDDDAVWWNFGFLLGPVNQSNRVNEEAILGGLASTGAEAAIIDGYNMDSVWGSHRNGSVTWRPMA